MSKEIKIPSKDDLRRIGSSRARLTRSAKHWEEMLKDACESIVSLISYDAQNHTVYSGNAAGYLNYYTGDAEYSTKRKDTDASEKEFIEDLKKIFDENSDLEFTITDHGYSFSISWA